MTESIQFDINEFLVTKKGGQYSKTVSSSPSQQTALQNFNTVKRAVQEFFHSKVQDKTLSESEREERQRIEHQATVGDQEAMDMLVDEIAAFLRNSPYQNVKYDRMFDSLAHAIFEHIYRFKNFYKWQLHPESPSAKIVGKEIWFKIDGKFEKQAEEFESEEEVYEIIRLLEQSNPNFAVNGRQPQGELDLSDGTRVTLTRPPRTLVPTIVFRRFIVNKFSFLEQARRQTIHQADIPIFQLLAKIRANTVIAGAVESGKSTMLKTFYSERPSDLVALLIEEHPETYLKRDFPNRLVHEFSIKDVDIQKVLRTVLRFDHDYVIMQEVRGIEADSAIEGASRGAKGLLMTYHITEPSKVAEQLAQHIVDIYPSRRYINEVRRVAQTLQLGITMETFRGNQKRVTSVFEFNYDYGTDSASVTYLMKFNSQTNEWEYNDRFSGPVRERLLDDGEETLEEFQNLISKRASESPMQGNTTQPINFKDLGEFHMIGLGALAATVFKAVGYFLLFVGIWKLIWPSLKDIRRYQMRKLRLRKNKRQEQEKQGKTNQHPLFVHIRRLLYSLSSKPDERLLWNFYGVTIGIFVVVLFSIRILTSSIGLALFTGIFFAALPYILLRFRLANVRLNVSLAFMREFHLFIQSYQKNKDVYHTIFDVTQQFHDKRLRLNFQKLLSSMQKGRTDEAFNEAIQLFSFSVGSSYAMRFSNLLIKAYREHRDIDEGLVDIYKDLRKRERDLEVLKTKRLETVVLGFMPLVTIPLFVLIAYRVTLMFSHSFLLSLNGSMAVLTVATILAVTSALMSFLLSKPRADL